LDFIFGLFIQKTWRLFLALKMRKACQLPKGIPLTGRALEGSSSATDSETHHKKIIK